MIKMGIITNIMKDSNFKFTSGIIRWLLDRNCKVYIPDDDYKINFENIAINKESLFEICDIIIAIGGDGTILSTAREVMDYQKPILGINMGHLGFISEVEIKDVYIALQKIIDNNYIIEDRMMLRAEIIEKNQKIHTLYALNDMCISKGVLSRIISLSTYINESYVNTYNADGLLISTPTGSTAYSLSAGGPIVSPNVNVTLITPICAHSLTARTLVVSEKDKIKVKVCGGCDEVYLTADGQEGYRLHINNMIMIEKSTLSSKFIKVSGLSFYDVLRKKLK